MRAARWWLSGILLLGGGLRLWLAAAQEMTRADAGTLGRTLIPYASVLDVTRTARETDAHPPFYYLALRAGVRIVGFDVARMKILHALVGMLWLVLIYAWVRSAAGAKAALWAAFLTAASGYHLLWSVNMRMYMPNGLLLTAAAWFAWRYWTRPASWASLAGYAASVAVALHTHYYAIFGWIALVAWAARDSLVRSPRRLGWWCAQLAIVLAFLPWFLWGFMHQMGVGRTATVKEGAGTLLLEAAFSPFRFFFHGLRQEAPWMALLLSAAIAGLYLAAFRGRRDPREGAEEGPGAAAPSPIRHFAFLAGIPILLALAYSLVRAPIFGLHYLAVSFPGACALAALGLARVRRPVAAAFACLYLGANALTLPALRSLGNEGYRRSWERFEKEGSFEDALVFNNYTHSGEGFVFFARGRGVPRDRLRIHSLVEDPIFPEVPFLTHWHDWKEPARAVQSAADRIASLLADHRRVWFINLSHGDGAFRAFEEALSKRFSPRVEECGGTRLFILEHPRGS